MAEKRPIIVIKKVIVAGAGHHGGSWKVALADFMTALMAFFLVMWLLGQSEETKKAVSDYFSTPSVIEYNFQNFGVELTLEKLFLDILNEPLKAFQSFMEPADKTPNLLDMGSTKVVAAFLADQINDFAKNVTVTPDGYDFDIPDSVLFERGSADPSKNFIMIMDKIKVITSGLRDANIKITSGMVVQTVPDKSVMSANKVATERFDSVRNKILAGTESNTVTVSGGISVKDRPSEVDPAKMIGFIRIKISQKEMTVDGRKQRKLESLFGSGKVDMSDYENYVREMSGVKNERTPQGSRSEAARRSDLKEQVDRELRKEMEITDPSSQTE